MNKEKLYELSRDLILEYEPGISVEIDDFFEDENQIIDSFTKEYKNNRYFVNIKLKEFDYQTAREIFSSFVNFIEYSNSTFYVCEKESKRVSYTLLSKMVNSKGFLCEVIFN